MEFWHLQSDTMFWGKTLTIFIETINISDIFFRHHKNSNNTGEI